LVSLHPRTFHYKTSIFEEIISIDKFKLDARKLINKYGKRDTDACFPN